MRLCQSYPPYAGHGTSGPASRLSTHGQQEQTFRSAEIRGVAGSSVVGACSEAPGLAQAAGSFCTSGVSTSLKPQYRRARKSCSAPCSTSTSQQLSPFTSMSTSATKPSGETEAVETLQC